MLIQKTSRPETMHPKPSEKHSKSSYIYTDCLKPKNNGSLNLASYHRLTKTLLSITRVKAPNAEPEPKDDLLEGTARFVITN